MKAQAQTEAVPDARWMRERLEELCAIHRPSASPGEREAAEWLAGELREVGARNVRIEEEPEANGTFWWSIGLLSGAGVLAGRGRGTVNRAELLKALAHPAGVRDGLGLGLSLHRSRKPTAT